MSKQIFTPEKGWHSPEHEVLETFPQATAPNLAPAAVFADADNEPSDFKLPFKRVLNDHLVVKIDKFRYKGNIKIPRNSQGKPTTGVVLGIADNIKDIEIGDRILYSQFAGYLLKFQGVPLLRCLGYNEVLAVLNDDAPEIESEGA